MKLREYKKLAPRTCYDIGQTIHNATVYTERKHRLHMQSGIITEVGEVLDLYKKRMMYGKSFTHEMLVDEFGDWGWYVINWIPEWEEVKWPKKIINPLPDTESIIEAFEFYMPVFASDWTEAFETWWIFSKFLGLDTGEVFDYNIKKLNERFPDKFDPKKARSRNS